MLQAPTNEDLGRRPTVPRRDLRNDWMIESMTASEGAVCFQLNLLADAEFQQFLLIEEGMELDLVHGGRCRGRAEQFLQVSDRVVAHPDRPGESLVTDLEERLPRLLSQTWHGPVDKVQVNVIETELAAALLERPQPGFVPLVVVPELRRDEDLFAWDPALPNRGSEVALVPIQFRGIEQTVADLEGGRDRLAGLLARAGLPHTEAEDWHRVPVVEGDAGSEGEGHPGADGTRATSTLTWDHHDFGMSFIVSTKGVFTTMAARVPFDVDTRNRLPIFEWSMPRSAYPMFFSSRGEYVSDVTWPTFRPSAWTSQ